MNKVFQYGFLGMMMVLIAGCKFGSTVSEPDLSDKVPEVFPLEKLIYSYSKLTECTVNVFQIESQFGEYFSDDNLVDEDLIEDMRNGIYPHGETPWQPTPIDGKVGIMSKASTSMSFAHNCLEGQDHYKNLIADYRKNSGAFFKYDNKYVFIYTPDDNILFLIE